MDTKVYLKGKSKNAYEFFGAHKKDIGYIFRLFAPNASKVEIIGDFNDWQEQSLRKYPTGVFSLTIKNAKANDRYKYVVYDSNGNTVKKLDPFSRSILVDENCSLVSDDTYEFENNKVNKDALNIYQVHLGLLLKDKSKSIKEHYEDLIYHAKDNNFTHISLMPITEYKNYKSMGYSSIGLFALSDRYGNINIFKEFIDKCHQENIGLILELDLGEFDPDPYYLADFDSTRLYDYDYNDIRYNYYGSMNFDLSKNASKSYLLSVVNYWIKEFNIDGICISNIENIIYWQGDKNRGVNSAGEILLREIIELIRSKKSLSIASYNGIYDLDFDFDYIFDNSMRSLIRIFQKKPYDRNNYKSDIYKLINKNNSDRILGFSYIDSYLEEASLAMKMHGDMHKFDQLKSLLTLIYTLNSRKMIFMGDEFADLRTFSIYNSLNFKKLDKSQEYFNKFFKDLTRTYINNEALSNKSSITQILDIGGYSIYAYIREFNDKRMLIIVNLTDVDYSIVSPYNLVELINSHNLNYGESGNINGSIEKNEKIRIEAYGAVIFQIKKKLL